MFRLGSKSERGPITALSVTGFKSLFKKQRVDIKPMTILAGANSSGKSSIMQPLLLLKQTLEAPYDPGALLLDGAHVRFASAEQLFSRKTSESSTAMFSVTMDTSTSSTTVAFKRDTLCGLSLARMDYVDERNQQIRITRDTSHDEIMRALPSFVNAVVVRNEAVWKKKQGQVPTWTAAPERCFFSFEERLTQPGQAVPFEGRVVPAQSLIPPILGIVHVPGLRGNPQRSYGVSAVGERFTGPFEHYVASVVYEWQSKDRQELSMLSEALSCLGLARKIEARRTGDTQVEILVNRRPEASKEANHDFVSIADVGFGVSQSLPVIVALLVAKPDQMVYLEQPELHLHPRAQSNLAALLCEAAKRGVRVVVETHSDLLLLGIQTLVAEGFIDPGIVKLHWFERDKQGFTKVTSADLDEEGAYGDWPEDFGDVSLKADSRYLDAAEAHISKPRHAK